MCTCNRENDSEEYRTAISEFEMFPSPENLHTSTRHEEDFGLDFSPEYASTPINVPHYQRVPRVPLRKLREQNLTFGVAIVPRRIDFDAEPNNEDTDVEEDLDGKSHYDRCYQLKIQPQRPTLIPESRNHGGTYKLRRTRPPQYSSEYRRQHIPRIVKVTPCGKCLKI
ncbi:hypothetical protein PUN28_001915 [Cardiocondyla obscurior]|uniref:Uncharacterized protein n=1 Tax=Cardiocondyla obscurior TaxID=286306 RepID=A0AAW2GRR4_9HYME